MENMIGLVVFLVVVFVVLKYTKVGKKLVEKIKNYDGGGA